MEPNPQAGGAGAADRRQFVSFTFYRVAPEWRRLPDEGRRAMKEEFARALEHRPAGMMLLTYSTVGLKADADLLLWQIAESPLAHQDLAARLRKTNLGGYLETPYAYLAMTKRSVYVDGHVHEGQDARRLRIVPGQAAYLFVYPFVKTRDWYLLPISERQRMMNAHIEMGHKYPSVKLNTTYSFGIDDQEFVVAFETDRPEDFLDLVMALREVESSRFTLRDTPIFTCVRKEIRAALEDLG